MSTFTIENWQNVEDSDRLSIVVIISLYVFLLRPKKITVKLMIYAGFTQRLSAQC